MNSSTVVAHFQDADVAQRALADLETAGFSAEEAGYVSHEDQAVLPRSSRRVSSPRRDPSLA